MSRHATVWVAGRDVTPDTLGECEIVVGRSTFTDAPDAASLSLSIEWPAWASIPVIGDTVHVLGWLPGDEGTARALFAGNVTDVAWEGGIVSVLAVDPSRKLDGVTVGDVPWPMEAWGERVARILALARAALPDEAHWLQPRYGNDLAPIWAQKVRVPWRDVDRQPVLTLLGELLDPVGVAWAYMPHMGGVSSDPHPADPRAWLPRMKFVHLIPVNVPVALDVSVSIPASMITADPPPRVAMNLGPVCNEWVVKGVTVGGDGKPVEGDGWEVVAALPEAARRRYGESSASVDSGFAHDPGNALYPRPSWLARELLDRTGYPTWAADGVLIPLDGAALDADRDWCRAVWTQLLAETPVGAVGGRVYLEGVQGTSSDLGGWVVEGLRVAWLEDGWEVEFTGLSDPAVYYGQATAPPIDPRNPVSLADAVPAVIGTGGRLLQPLLHKDGVQGAAGGVWRVVAPDLGTEGPEVPNGGVGTFVPMPVLPPGGHRLVVQWLTLAGATVPAEWLELPVTVAAGSTWDDMAMTWDQIGVDVTWDEVE